MNITPPCRTYLDTHGVDLWFPPPGHETYAARKERVATAAAICATCPLIDACRQAADDIGADNGVWAGTDRDPKHGPVREQCGSVAGRQAHRRAGEKLCDDCGEAWRQYKAERRALA